MFFISQLSGLVRNFNTGIYSDTRSVINVKLCMILLLIELYLFIPLSVTLTLFQGHSSVKQIELKFLCSYQIKLKLYTVVNYVTQIMNTLLFLMFTHVQGRSLTFPHFWGKNLSVGFFSDVIKVRSFKLCVVITLLGVCIVISGLMTLFQGHMFIRNINCKLHVLDFCPLQFQRRVVATYMKKIMYSIYV